jgi:hypothetical protein
MYKTAIYCRRLGTNEYPLTFETWSFLVQPLAFVDGVRGAKYKHEETPLLPPFTGSQMIAKIAEADLGVQGRRSVSSRSKISSFHTTGVPPARREASAPLDPADLSSPRTHGRRRCARIRPRSARHAGETASGCPLKRAHSRTAPRPVSVCPYSQRFAFLPESPSGSRIDGHIRADRQRTV